MEFTVEEINDFLEKSYFYNIKIDIFKLPNFLKKSKLYDEKYKDIADGKIISDNLIEIDSKYFCDSFEIDSLKKPDSILQLERNFEIDGDGYVLREINIYPVNIGSNLTNFDFSINDEKILEDFISSLNKDLEFLYKLNMEGFRIFQKTYSFF